MHNLTEIALRYGKRIDNWTRSKPAQDLIRSGDVIFHQSRNIKGCFTSGGTLATDKGLEVFTVWCERKQNHKRFVYLAYADSLGLAKFGIASDVKQRFRGLRQMCPVELQLICFYAVEDPEGLESAIFKRLNYCRKKGEWFSLPVEKAKRIIGEMSLSTRID